MVGLVRLTRNTLPSCLAKPCLVAPIRLPASRIPAALRPAAAGAAVTASAPANFVSLAPVPVSSAPKFLASIRASNANGTARIDARLAADFAHINTLFTDFKSSIARFLKPIDSTTTTTIVTASRETLTIRRATHKDTDAIYSLIAGPMANGSILPVSRAALSSTVRNYVVCHVDGVFAGSASIKPFSRNEAEFTKICTSPAYQGRGIASHLVSKLIQHATADGYEYVFALTTAPAMARVFTKLQFQPVDRSLLCAKWRDGYDMARPSKAYYLPVLADPFTAKAADNQEHHNHNVALSI
ncbi:hypothetical protein CAOG_01468 [Capsaspora owczarzaki ATCC 30864]|uniref:hypothetical protein n=1 Tax=Capsaspora owczarzaki (strain ATCC 30864) TaxID=595528 RepID=UPI0001FE3FF3|nr:hypothetical protein CAOG_01468 [Capsaspora owczarzaki ATCC 30864]|eukprot:XP_004364336.1 hypothetical protein CAOG_01468 [Capsaspora owczarzaki ATCC 30864]